MRAIDELLELLNAQPRAERPRFTISRDGRSIFVTRGAMQAVATEVEDGRIEVAYEHALHELTRERVSPPIGALLLLAIYQRKGLHPVEVPAD